ncbi:uncharacterized protein LOC125570182 [Nematostella vectensis]|uniref:uncharacterized protein LOC125570182 n=1 Tax=Nematostella vectensis TaxID=45351 RepID=UPI00207788AD|nr:uncharacterized protein LOC125570182 [Nematostella vectensis]
MNRKAASICDLVISKRIDVLALVETWLTAENNSKSTVVEETSTRLPVPNCSDPTVADVINTLRDFDFIHLPRAGRGGGIGFFLRKALNVKPNTSTVFKALEYVDLSNTASSSSMRLVTVYRPPPSKVNKLTTRMFFDDFSVLLEHLAMDPGKLIITGDFNFHIEDPGDADAVRLLDMLDAAGFEQKVVGPTHRKGHTLDLVVVRDGDLSVRKRLEIVAFPNSVSDHSAIICDVDMPKPCASKKILHRRPLRKINFDSWCNDIRDPAIYSSAPSDDSDCNVLCDQYNTVLNHFIGKHALVRTFSVTLRPYSPWYDDSLRLLKRQKRKAERRYVSSRLEIHRQMYEEKCRAYSIALNVAKRNFYKDQISGSNQTQLFRLIDGLFRVKPVPLLPSYESPQALAEDFISFFTTKIQHLKDNLRSSPLLTMEMSVTPAQPQCVASFPEFSAVSVSYIRDILQQSKSKSCILDPVPTSVLKQSIDVIAPAITSIVNASLSSGVFPTSLKGGVINPSIKKQS